MMIEQGDEHVGCLKREENTRWVTIILRNYVNLLNMQMHFLLLLLENYKNTPVTANTSMGDDENDVNLNRIMLKHYFSPFNGTPVMPILKMDTDLKLSLFLWQESKLS
jgi:hypothetical protein